MSQPSDIFRRFPTTVSNPPVVPAGGRHSKFFGIHRLLYLLCGALPFAAPPAFGQLIRQAAATLALPAGLASSASYNTSDALSITFSSPMATAFPAGQTNRLFVIQKGGLMSMVDNLSTTPVAGDFMDLATYLTNQGTPLAWGTGGDERGLLAIAFHPDYQNNGYFYLYFSLTIGGQLHQRLARFQATLPASGGYLAATGANPATMTELLTIYDQAGNHNGGEIQFDNDGYLYLSLGDEGGSNDQYNNSRYINRDFWGQLIRIDVDRRPENLEPNDHSQPGPLASAIHRDSGVARYKVPADNPFIGTTSWHDAVITPESVRTEIFATGFRNPFRFSIDAVTGRIFLGDVGQSGSSSREEVNLVVAGGDYGWSWRQGLDLFTSGPSPANPPASGFHPIDPIFNYDNSNNGTGSGNDSVVWGVSVIGGIVYRGNLLPELQGAYLFAEYTGNNAIVALRETSSGTWQAERLTTRSSISHFGRHPGTGEPLLTSPGSNIVYRLHRNGTQPPPPPQLLSQTGVFASPISALTPQPGVVPYDPNVPSWNDHAITSRWFGIKNLNDRFTFSADENWTFPTGMVWVEHFDFDLERGNPATRRKLETRILVKTASDVYGLSYRWRTDQTDADLVAAGGLSEAITSAVPAQTWRFPSRNECRTCHTAVAGSALSFNTRQLNREKIYGSQSQNQLTAFSDAGYCTSPIDHTRTLPALARADDVSQSLEWRVRSYLAVHCAQCHQPGGSALGNWDARPTTPTDSAQLINGLLANDGGNPDARWCVPGDAPDYGQPTDSMVLKRLRGDAAGRMPPLATSVRDLEAEALFTEWITGDLPSRQSFAQWQTVNFPSGGPDADPDADPDGDGQDNTLEFLRRTNPTSPTPPSLPSVEIDGGNVEVTFSVPANRASVIETSVNLADWLPWDVPGNAPVYPATDGTRTLVAPVGHPRQFFRPRLETP